MKIENLEEGLDRYGGDFARWPMALRAEAETLAASDVRAARLVIAARRLDAALADAVLPMSVDSAMIGRVVSGLASSGIEPAAIHGGSVIVNDSVAVRPTPRLLAWASAAVVAFLVTGYAVGVAIPVSQGEDAFAGLMFGNSSTSDTAADSESVL